MRERQRIDDALSQSVLERLAGHDLDDAPENRVAAVAIAPGLAGVGDLREVGAPVDVPRERVVAAAGIGEVVAVEAARVGEEVAEGHGGP